jgi:hypothetical protein
MSKKETPPKHLPYFKLTEACRKEGCPVCRLVEEWVGGYFGGLLYERVNDPAFRKRFRENGGFCNHHSYRFMSYRDGLAVALTHRDLLGDWIEAVAKNRKPPGSGEAGCIVCEDSRRAERRYLETLAGYIDDPEFGEIFRSSEGLCLPHYAMLRERARPVPGWLAEFQQERYRSLLALLDRFLDSCNFSRGEAKPALDPEEELVWKKAVRIIQGYEGQIR